MISRNAVARGRAGVHVAPMGGQIEWLNYHHLLYFWVVIREGGIVPAGKALRVSHSTVSAQLHALEDHLGEQLVTKVGRRLQLTEMGRLVHGYAEEIFSLGREMVDTVRGRATGQRLRLNVGVADAVPKLLVRKLLEPALALPMPVRLTCREAPFEELLADLGTHQLDVVISDAPVPTGHPVQASSHFLGHSDVGIFAAPKLLKGRSLEFPECLDEAPMLLPLQGLSLRRTLDVWFRQHDLAPVVVGEFEDSALMKAFGSEGMGFFPAPMAMEAEVCMQYHVRLVGSAPSIQERFYAVSVERRLKHPAVIAIANAGTASVFAARR